MCKCYVAQVPSSGAVKRSFSTPRSKLKPYTVQWLSLLSMKGRPKSVLGRENMLLKFDMLLVLQGKYKSKKILVQLILI